MMFTRASGCIQEMHLTQIKSEKDLIHADSFLKYFARNLKLFPISSDYII